MISQKMLSDLKKEQIKQIKQKNEENNDKFNSKVFYHKNVMNDYSTKIMEITNNYNTINEQNFSNNSSYIKSKKIMSKLIKNEQEEEMWKHILKNGESKQYHIGLISDENKLNFIFKSLENKEYKKVKDKTKINVKELINRLANNNDFKMSDDMLMFAIKNFDVVNKDLELENKEWELIFKKSDINFLKNEISSQVIEGLNKIAWRPNSKTKEVGYNHKSQMDFIKNFFEPYIKVSAGQKNIIRLSVLNTVVDLMLDGGIPKISDESLKLLIEDSADTYHILRYLLEHEQKIEKLNEKSQTTDISYLNYISKENAELIIDKANKDRISLELLYISYRNNQTELKELRQKIYDKILSEPKDYIKVHLNVKDNPFSKELINEKIKEIIQDKKERESLLSYWIENFYVRTILKNNNPKNNQKLKDEEILLLIDSLKEKDNNFLYERYDSGVINRAELGYKLLETVKEASVGIKIKEKQSLPYLKEILNKSKNTNEFLLNYYLDESLEKFLDISEEELIKYIKKSKTNAYKEDFFKKCFDVQNNNCKKTGTLLNFAIDLVDMSEKNQYILKKWFYHIRTNKIYASYENIKKEDIEELINNEKLLEVMAPTILISIKHIEDRWNIKVDKEKIIKKIDFNKISYTYEELVNIEEVSREKVMKYGLMDKVEDFTLTERKLKVERKELINFWEKIINQKDKSGEPIFSIKEIGAMLSEIKLIYPHMRNLVMETMFAKKEILVKEVIEAVSINKDVEEKIIKNLDSSNQSFIEELLKRDIKVFENFAEEIIRYCGNNEVIQDENQKDKEITMFVKCLLKLKAEVEINEDLILKAYSRSRVKEIDEKLIKNAKIVSLMSEEELNNIDIAYDLVKRNKNNFYKLGKQIVEFLQLDTDNSEKLLTKYSEENVKGVMGYFKRKEKNKLQEKINEAIKYNEDQKINPEKIKKELSTISMKNLSEEESLQVNDLMNKLMGISKDELKILSLMDNSDLKRCMENTFLKIIKTYSKLTEQDKIKNPEIKENFIELIKYCEEKIDEKIGKKPNIKMKV